MKITIFGASGATGHHLVNQALAADHEITAFVRNASRLPIRHSNLLTIVGDFDRADTVLRAVEGANVVISVLGVRKKGNADVCTHGVRCILKAMSVQQEELQPQPQHKRRLIVLSAYGAGDTQGSSLSASLIRLVLAAKMRDKDQMEELVRTSGTDWTIVRPPALTNGLLSGKYQAGVAMQIGFFATLSRADLAQFILREAIHRQYVGQAPTVAS